MSEQDAITARTRGAPGWLVSVGVHALILLVAAWITWSVAQPPREREAVVSLGTSDSFEVASPEGEDTEAESTSAAGQTAAGEWQPPSLSLPEITPAPPESFALAADLGAFAAADPVLTGLPTEGEAGLSPGDGGLLDGTSGEFQRLVRGMGRRGLDVVLVLDATDSMDPTIDDAKARLRDVVAVLSGILRDAGGMQRPGLIRFGVVAYKDYGDDYGTDATRHIPLQHDLDAIYRFIDGIAPGGGGDIPEPVHRALGRAAGGDMGWRRDRQAVILLVGDAPVHATGRAEAYRLARQFRTRRSGTVSTIDVGGATTQGTARSRLLPDFARIAEEGGGSAFLLREQDRFWQYLLTSIFGEAYARDVDLILEKYASGPAE